MIKVEKKQIAHDLHVKLDESEMAELRGEATRRGDPWTLSSVARRAFRLGLAEMRREKVK